MTRDDLDRDAYNEQAYEMKANGIPVPTFAAWKERNQRLRDMFTQRDKARRSNHEQG